MSSGRNYDYDYDYEEPIVIATILCRAICGEYYLNLKSLVVELADGALLHGIFATDKDGHMPLHLAAEKSQDGGFSAMIKSLANEARDSDNKKDFFYMALLQKNKNDETVIHVAAKYQQDESSLDTLWVNIRCMENPNVLMNAIFLKDSNGITTLDLLINRKQTSLKELIRNICFEYEDPDTSISCKDEFLQRLFAKYSDGKIPLPITANLLLAAKRDENTLKKLVQEVDLEILKNAINENPEIIKYSYCFPRELWEKRKSIKTETKQTENKIVTDEKDSSKLANNFDFSLFGSTLSLASKQNESDNKNSDSKQEKFCRIM